MPDWFPKPPRTAGDALTSESWIDFLLLSNTGNRILVSGLLCLAVFVFCVWLLRRRG